MWVIVHVCSGLALGVALGGRGDRPILGLWILVPLAILAHALLDLVPHWDYTHSPRKVICAMLDVGLSVGLVLALWASGALPGWLLVVGSVSALPDLDVLDAVLPVRRDHRWFPSHWRRFPHGSCRAAVGIPIQVGVVVLSALIVWAG